MAAVDPVVASLQDKFDSAGEVSDVRPNEAVALYQSILAAEQSNDEINKIKEQAIYKLGELYAKLGQAQALGQLLKDIRPFFSTIAKARTAKIVRSLIDFVSKLPDTLPLQIDLCKESIEWTKQEKRTFLRQRIETKLVQLYIDAKNYVEATAIINPLLREVKRLDDKALLVELYLLESQVQHKLRNIPKSRASLTAARTAGNAIYCPPLLQAQIDLQSGKIHTEEKDYRTAYSYFYEAFEGYNSLNDSEAVQALKYMLLCKIMTSNAEDVQGILSGKLALQYAGRDAEAMRAIANAHRDRSLKEFERVLEQYAQELKGDDLISLHLSELYDEMLSQNLCRIIEPFSCVEIAHIAHLISLDVQLVEKKLSQMILDKQFHGILDQGNGWLLLFEDRAASETYQGSLDTIQSMSRVVDSLFDRAKELN